MHFLVMIPPPSLCFKQSITLGCVGEYVHITNALDPLAWPQPLYRTLSIYNCFMLWICFLLALDFMVDFQLDLELHVFQKFWSIPLPNPPKVAQKLLPPNAVACIPPFVQFVERGINWFHENISSRLHDHSFSSIIFDMDSNSCHMCLRSCASSRGGCMIFCSSNCSILLFGLRCFLFFFLLRIRLGLPHCLPHPLALRLIHCICGQPL